MMFDTPVTTDQKINMTKVMCSQEHKLSYQLHATKYCQFTCCTKTFNYTCSMIYMYVHELHKDR